MKKLMLWLILGIFMLNLISAWSDNKFYNSPNETSSWTSENMSLIEKTLYNTRYLKIPNGTIVTTGYFNLSDFIIKEIDKELNYSSTDDHATINAFDEDWGTWSYMHEYTPTTIYQNYTVNHNMTNLSITVKLWGGDQDGIGCTIFNESLFNYSSNAWEVVFSYNICPQSELIFKINISSPLNYLKYNIIQTKQYHIANNATHPIRRNYEEKINTDDYFEDVENVSVYVSNTRVLYKGGMFNMTNNQTGDLSGVINGFSSACICNGCVITTGYCFLPFYFNSTTTGVLNYRGLLFEDLAKLLLYFVNNTLGSTNVNWTLTDNNSTIWKNESSYFTNQNTIANGKVLIDFNMRYEGNGTNLSQSYEYINTGLSFINETLLVLPNINKEISVRVGDKDNKLIENVRVRSYCRIGTTTKTNLILTNQKLTDGIGVTNLGMYTNSVFVYNNYCKIEVIAEGYISQNIIISPNTQNTQIVFKLAKATTVPYQGIYLNYLPTTFNENTTTIYGAYYYLSGQNIEVTTTYRRGLGYARKVLILSTTTTDTYTFTLNKDIDWDSTNTTDIIIETWRYQSGSWVNIRNDSIPYLTVVKVIDLKPLATSQWAITIFLILLILASGFISYITTSSTAGVNFYFGGLVANPLILSGWKAGVLSGIGFLYFVLIIIKRFNKE